MGLFDVARTLRLAGKNVFITGGNCGIGYETAKELAIRGANVTIGCRNEERMSRAIDSIQHDMGVNKNTAGSINGLLLDLESFESVRKAADTLHSQLSHIDICILNAGVMRAPLRLSEQIELHQKVNHFSHFLLLNSIMDLIENAPSRPRVISVSSRAHLRGNGKGQYWKAFINEEDYHKNNLCDPLATWEPYGESKLANICHMRQLAKLKPNIGCFSLHPGVIPTDIVRHLAESSPILFMIAKPFLHLFLITQQQGAQTSVYCAMAEKLENPEFSGKYFSDIGNDWGVTETKFATDELAQQLWHVSETITESTLIN